MRKSRIAGVFIAAAAILLLSGCVRFQAHLTVSPDNTLNGDIVVASVVGDGANAKSDANDRAKAIEQKLLPNLSGADGVTRNAYDEDGYVGSRFSLNHTPLNAINSSGSEGSLQLTRTGDTFEFTGKVDFTPESDDVPKDADTSNIQVAITFPGTVTDHNGRLDGTRVSWNMSYEGSLDMHATASAEPVGPPAWVWWLIIGLGILAIVAVIVIAAVMSNRRRATSDATTAGLATPTLDANTATDDAIRQ
jgi:hypothetical protein